MHAAAPRHAALRHTFPATPCRRRNKGGLLRGLASCPLLALYTLNLQQ